MAAILLTVAACGASGCGTISDQTASQLLSEPGRYNAYPCKNIEAELRTVRTRNTELEQLMARASQGAGGNVMGAMAYRTEYLQTRGRLKELTKAAQDKKCAIDGEYSSGRSVY